MKPGGWFQGFAFTCWWSMIYPAKIALNIFALSTFYNFSSSLIFCKALKYLLCSLISVWNLTNIHILCRDWVICWWLNYPLKHWSYVMYTDHIKHNKQQHGLTTNHVYDSACRYDWLILVWKTIEKIISWFYFWFRFKCDLNLNNSFNYIRSNIRR